MINWFVFWILMLVIALFLSFLLIYGPKSVRESFIFNFCAVSFLYVARAAVIYTDPTDLVLPNYLNLLVGIPVFLFGAIVILISLVKMKLYSMSGPTEKNPLNTKGVYGIVRHPIYLGEILWPFGAALIMGKLLSLYVALGFIIYFIVYTRLEEQALVRIHGDAYRAYQKRVPMLIPLKIRGKKLRKEQ